VRSMEGREVSPTFATGREKRGILCDAGPGKLIESRVGVEKSV
jgi:hypothetical protein